MIENYYQSDKIVKIYSYLNFYYTKELISNSFDIGSYLTHHLSESFNQNWIVRAYDIIEVIKNFSTNFTQITKQEGLLDVFLIKTSDFIQNESEIEIFLNTTMRISFVNMNKIIYLIDKEPKNHIDMEFTNIINEISEDDSSLLLNAHEIDYSDLTLEKIFLNIKKLIQMI